MYISSNRRSLGSVLAAFFFLFSVTILSAFEGDASNGKKLFKSQCASCHKLDKKLIGPAQQVLLISILRSGYLLGLETMQNYALQVMQMLLPSLRNIMVL